MIGSEPARILVNHQELVVFTDRFGETGQKKKKQTPGWQEFGQRLAGYLPELIHISSPPFMGKGALEITHATPSRVANQNSEPWSEESKGGL